MSTSEATRILDSIESGDARAADELIAAGAADERVMAGLAAEAVGAIAAGNQVVAIAAEDGGRDADALAEADLVVAAQAFDVDALHLLDGHEEEGLVDRDGQVVLDLGYDDDVGPGRSADGQEAFIEGEGERKEDAGFQRVDHL